MKPKPKEDEEYLMMFKRIKKSLKFKENYDFFYFFKLKHYYLISGL